MYESPNRIHNRKIGLVIDDVDSRGGDTIVWRIELQQLHGFPVVVVCGDGGELSESAPMHKAEIAASIISLG
jgi:hypothetical protein